VPPPFFWRGLFVALLDHLRVIMTLAFTPPPCPDSVLRHFDPRWKLAALSFALVATALLHTLGPAVTALAAVLLLALLARLPLRWYLERLGALALFLILFTAPLPFLVSGEGKVWHWGPLSVSEHGLAVAVLLCVKAVTLVTLALVLLVTAPLEVSLKAAHALRVPGLLVHLGLLSYRYLFVLADELARLRIALRVRGYRNRPTWASYRTVGHLAGALMVRGQERADRVAQAMRCRGFDGQFRSLTAFHTRAIDVLAFAGITFGAVLLAWWDLAPR
jgi:cobalt/nickel transport system permease protein